MDPRADPSVRGAGPTPQPGAAGGSGTSPVGGTSTALQAASPAELSAVTQPAPAVTAQVRSLWCAFLTGLG
jgi:hypothetical protein